MAGGKTSHNKLEDLDYQPEWDTDPWCCLFRNTMKKRWPSVYWSGTDTANPEEICQRIFFRELFCEHPIAYQYAGWFLSNISCDLATEEPAWVGPEWEDGEY